MTRRIVLIPVDADTGEVVNKDGSVGGKVVPKPLPYWDNFLAASKVDISGAEVKLPERKTYDAHTPPIEVGRVVGHNACLDAIKAQMPKGE